MTNPSRTTKYWAILSKATTVILLLALLYTCASCRVIRDVTIPTDPTIWVVSEIYFPKGNRFNGMVGYKLIPVNPGSINAKPTWKLDFKGKYTVGQRVDFQPITQDAPGPR